MVKHKVLILSLLVTSTISFAKVKAVDPCENLANEYKKLEIASPLQPIARCQKVQNGNVKNKAAETLTEGSVCIAKFANPSSLSELPGACDPSEAPARADFYLLSGTGYVLTEKGEKLSRVLPSVMKVDLNDLNKMKYYGFAPMKPDDGEGAFFNQCIKTLRGENFDCKKALLGTPFSFFKMESGACDSEDHLIVKKEGPDQYEVLYDYDKNMHKLYLKETVQGEYFLPQTKISAVLDCEEVQ